MNSFLVTAPAKLPQLTLRTYSAASLDASELTSSSTEKEIATVDAANADDVDKAVKAAHTALKSDEWKKMPANERGLLLSKLANYIEERKEVFATSDAWDNGALFEFVLLDPH